VTRLSAAHQEPNLLVAVTTYQLEHTHADVWAFHKDVDDQTLANADSPLNPLREAAEFVTRRLMLRRELQFVSDFFTTGVWADDVTGVAGAPSTGETKQWSDYASSDPISDLEAGKAEILGNTGMEANTLVLGYDVFKALKNHPDLVDRIKYTSSQTITTDMLAAMFDIPRVMVAKAVKATNNEGASRGLRLCFWQGRTSNTCCSKSRTTNTFSGLHIRLDWRFRWSGTDNRYFTVPYGVNQVRSYRSRNGFR
jgi:hypothetical protein